jgi:hypothetical protein
MYIGLHIKYPLFLPDFNRAWIFLTDFRTFLKYKILWKSVQWEPRCFMRTDGQADFGNHRSKRIWLLNWKARERWSWPNVTWSPGICLDRLKKKKHTQKNKTSWQSPWRDLNRGPRQYDECPSSYRIIVWDNIKMNLIELGYQVFDGPVAGFSWWR